MALEGTLNYLDVAHLLQVVGTAKKSGVLEIAWQEREARLFFESGRLIRAESNRGQTGIGTLLVEAGVLTGERLDAALEMQRNDPRQRRLGAILCDELDVPQAALQDMLRRQFEGVVFDVFSWPGGKFVFHFTDPDAVLDRFHLNPVQFILEVGVQAGLLAERGVDRQYADPERAPITQLVGDAAVGEACAEFWRRRGHRVVQCERVEEAMGFLQQVEEEGQHPIVLLDLFQPFPEDGAIASGRDILAGIQALQPEVTVITLIEADAPLHETLPRHATWRAVRKPAAQDLCTPERDSHLDVFLLRLEMTVAKVIEEALTVEKTTP